MKSRFLTLVFLLVVASATTAVSAFDFVVDGLCYAINADGESVTLCSYEEDPSQLIIPAEVTASGVTYTVTAIGEKAFYCCRTLTSVVIPNTVTTISNFALHACTGLTSLTIPSSVITIGEDALSGCNGLTSINVVSGNSKYDSRDNCNAVIETASNTLVVGCKNTIIPNSVIIIGRGAFYGCYGLKNFVIPNSVTTIGVSAFYCCDSLTSVVIPNSVITIGDNAFAHCIALPSIDIPNSVTTISSGAFANCWSLTSIDIPNSVTAIGNNAFIGCTFLASVTIPNSVSFIGYYAFDGTAWYNNQPNGLVYAGLVAYKYKGAMPSGTSIDVQEGTKGIAESAFNRCGGLTAVNIPNSVAIIGEQAFANCVNLPTVKIPSSVTFIGNHTFAYCKKLSRIEAYPDPANVVLGNSVFYAVPKDNTLHVLPEYLEAYQNADQWKDFQNILGDLSQPLPNADLNDDGSVDISDVNIVINMMLGKDTSNNGDITGDGQVDISDVNAVINAMLGK